METKLRSVIIDDCPGSRQLLSNFLDEFCKEDVSVVGTGDCCKTGIEIIKKVQPDIVFLDVEMPGGDGFDVLSAFKTSQRNFSLIFTSGYAKYSLEAIKAGAIDYLVKPIDIDELMLAVQKAKIDREQWKILTEKHYNQQLKNNAIPSKLIIDRNRDSSILSVSDIVYCSSRHKYTIFHMENNETIPVRQNLSGYEPVLIANSFIRISRSVIVNSAHIRQCQVSQDNFSTGMITLSNNETLGVSASKYSEVKRIFRNKNI